jgi:hypothetical protein
VDDAEHPPACEQRRAQQRLDALLAQDRIEDVGVIDVLDREGPPFGDDAAGETAADGDANAALDLLLDPARRARHKLVCLLVQEQDRAGIRREDLADPLEQLREQRVEREVRERSVGDALQLAQVLGCFVWSISRRYRPR